MLVKLEVDNFQSLNSLGLRLGRFTVITGPTGSGKTAVFRSMKLLAFNARGTSYITKGKTSCSVQAGVTEDDGETGWSLGIQRGARGKDAYYLAAPDNSPVREYTKLAGKVPEDIARGLRLSPLNFSSQFDPPYLLGESGPEIARTLGRLTNVTMVLSAAREANRRKLRIGEQLRDKEAELDVLRGQARAFAGLRERRAAVSEAESALAAHTHIVQQAGRLRVLLGQLSDAQATLQDVPPVIALPAVAQAQEAVGKLGRLRYLLDELVAAELGLRSAGTSVTVRQHEQKTAEQELSAVLREAGICPTCQRPIH